MKATFDQIDSVHRFATERLLEGNDLTIDALFELWRMQNTTAEERKADLLAVKAALRDMQSGDTGQPFEEFDRECCRRNGLSDDE